ncbi:MAG: hypothetical protein ACTSRZ_13225 [Promethearchaeota archaeon]
MTKTDVKKVALTISSIAGILVSSATIINNFFVDFDKFNILSYTIPQFIFLILISIGMGIVIDLLIVSPISWREKIEEAEEFFRSSVGLNKKEFSRFKEDLKKRITSTAKSNIALITEIGNYDFIHPDTLRSFVNHEIQKLLSWIGLETEPEPTVLVVDDEIQQEKIIMIPEREIDLSHLESIQSGLSKFKYIIILLLFIIPLLIYIWRS